MFLPSPLELTALGGAAVVGAGLVFFFLHVIRIAMILAIAGAVLLGAASIAYGYEKMGEAKIQPKLDAANAMLDAARARAAQYLLDAMAAGEAAAKITKDKNATIAQISLSFSQRLAAQDATIRALRVPGVVRQSINSAVSGVNATIAGAGANVASGAVATAADAADTTVGAWEEWSGQVVTLYGQCSAKVAGLQHYVVDLRAASAK